MLIYHDSLDVATCGVVAGDPPPEATAPRYDPAVFRDLLHRGMRESVRNALNGFENTLERTLERVGSVLDGRIAAAEALSGGPPAADDSSVEGAAAEGGLSAADHERRAWAVFALLRQRVALGVCSDPAPLREPATPLRRPVLEFGDRVAGVRQRGSETLDAGGGAGEGAGTLREGDTDVESGPARGRGSGSGVRSVAGSGVSGAGEVAEAGRVDGTGTDGGGMQQDGPVAEMDVADAAQL